MNIPFNFYNQHGYIVLKNIFSFEEILAMKNSVERLHNVSKTLKEDSEIFNSKFIINPDSKICQRVIWAGGIEPILLKYGQDLRITQLVSQLLNTNILMHIINQVHFKNPNDNVGFKAHQDIWNRDKQDGTYIDIDKKGSFIQTMIAIDEHNHNNGGLYIIPNSHKLNRVNYNDKNELIDSMGNKVDISKKIYLNLEPGDLALWSPYLIHGSDPNQSDKPRNALINGYCLEGANSRIYSGCGIGQKIIIK